MLTTDIMTKLFELMKVCCRRDRCLVDLYATFVSKKLSAETLTRIVTSLVPESYLMLSSICLRSQSYN